MFRVTDARLTYVCFALILGYCLFCFLPTIHADWYIIDDHEVIALMGRADHLPLSKIPAALGTTELDPSSTIPRYRPLYFVFLDLESAIWGKNASLWYAERLVVWCVFGLTLYAVAKSAMGLFLGFVFTIFELSDTYWSGMFARLGSGEAFGVMGISLIGIAYLLRRNIKSTLMYVLLILGVMICVGTKENFLPLIIAPILILPYKRRELRIAEKATLWIGILFTLWVFGNVVYRVSKVGTDMYMKDATAGSRAHLLFDFFELPSVLFWLVVVAIGVAAWIIAKPTRPFGRKPTFLEAGLVVNGLALAIYLSQYVFYNGDWPNYETTRYLLPGLLVRDFAIMLLVVAFADIFRTRAIAVSSRLPPFKDSITADLLLKTVIVCFLAVTAASRFSANRKEAWQMVSDSNKFMGIIHDAIHALSHDPNAALVIAASSPGEDYEPITSISRFFWAFGGKNPVLLQLDPATVAKSGSQDRLNSALLQTLTKVQRDGHEFISPFSAGHLSNCYSIGLSGPPSPDCPKGIEYR